MIDIKELNNNNKLNKGMVWIILTGKVKDWESPTLHKLLSVPVTNLEVKVEQWRDRLLLVHHETSRTEGPAICDLNGYLRIYSLWNLTLLICLLQA